MNTVQPLSWHPTPDGASSEMQRWLEDQGSLTLRIQERCTNFRVQPVFQSLSEVSDDEWDIMRLCQGELAMVREVYLYCGEQRVVFAHSVIHQEDLQGAWHELNNLGNQSLGTLLFSNPQIKRTPLEFKKLKAGHIIFDRASQELSTKPTHLWARRSLFTLHNQSILVTEVFLPAILELTR